MRLSLLPGVARLGITLFVLVIFGFHMTAQANLWVNDGGGSLPSPDQVLWKYHGRPDVTKLHVVLDPALPEADPHAMWKYLGDTPEEQAKARSLILGWVDAGAPRERWSEVAPVFTDAARCAQCHAAGGVREDLPFDTWEHVLPVTRADTGMATNLVLISAHNHLFSFAVLSLLLSLGVAYSPAAGRLRVLLVLGAFGGAVIDVASWLLTGAFGSPFHYAVLFGGGLFGVCTSLLAALVLEEVVLGGRVVGRLLRRRPEDRVA